MMKSKNKLKFNLLLSTSLLFSLAASAEAGKISYLPSPTEAQASGSRLFADAEGQIFLSWVEGNKETKESHFYYSKLDNNIWSTAKKIGGGSNWMVHWAGLPSVVVDGKKVAAQYLVRNPVGQFSTDVKLTFSNNDGEQFSQVITANIEGTPGENGMTSILPMGNGNTFVTWLDARNFKKVGDKMTGGTSLRGAVFNSKGENTNEWELDELACDCCSTSAAISGNGPIVVYRDRTHDEIRNISIVRQVKGKWSKPEVIHNDGWQIAGCPVNGPAISAKQQDVAVAWFTLKDKVPTINLKISDTAGKSFGKLIEVASGNTHGRVDIELLKSGDVVVSWLAVGEKSTKLMLAKYNNAGQLVDKLAVAEGKNSRQSGMPVITSLGNTVYMTWTDVETKKVKVAQISWSA